MNCMLESYCEKGILANSALHYAEIFFNALWDTKRIRNCGFLFYSKGTLYTVRTGVRIEIEQQCIWRI